MNAQNTGNLAIPEHPRTSLTDAVARWNGGTTVPPEKMARLFHCLPEPLLLALAATSTDPGELSLLAGICCRFIYDEQTGEPRGTVYEKNGGGEGIRPAITHHSVFKALANNPFLPEAYRVAMVLKPGAQGGSEITGQQETDGGRTHVFEYLRRNSYIPWGHYAANMADDAVRYRIADLSRADMAAIRHLYYQRTYIRMADQLGIPVPGGRRSLAGDELEALRRAVRRGIAHIPPDQTLRFNATLWGWNFGFDYTPTGYRLHGSHQQVHQQYAMIPASVPAAASEEGGGGSLSAFACGDLVAGFVRDFRRETGKRFFDCYMEAIENNRRTDGDPERERSLVVYADERVMLFVPKAQTSQWELQLMPREPVGNVLEADASTRSAIDNGMLTAVRVLSAMGARMITGIEYSKRFDDPRKEQHLLYCFLPRLPQSPGAFSEAQLRWINRHYPEDFAAACRIKLTELMAQPTA